MEYLIPLVSLHSRPKEGGGLHGVALLLPAF